MKSTIIKIKLSLLFKIIDIFLKPFKFIIEKLYLIHRKPFSQGYEFYKWKKINKFLDAKSKGINISGVNGLDERIVEYKWIFNELSKTKKNLKLLDAGSTINFPDIINRIKKKYKITIQTLYPENYSFYDQGISYVYEDLTKKIFKENSFDIITCISTLEHVGFDNSIYNYSKKISIKKKSISYLKVIENIKHCLKKNGILLLTIPYGRHQKFETLQQFNDKMVKKIIDKFKPQSKEISYTKYSYGTWKRCSKEECDKLNFNNYKGEESKDNLASARGVALIKLVK